MSRRLKQTAVAFFVILAAAQLVRPERSNPAIDVSRTIQAHVAPGVRSLAQRAPGLCGLHRSPGSSVRDEQVEPQRG